MRRAGRSPPSRPTRARPSRRTSRHTAPSSRRALRFRAAPGGNGSRVSRFRLIAAGCAVAIVVVLVLVLSGGGGSDTTLVSGSALANAADATGRVPGQSISVEGKVSADGLPQPLIIHMQGVENGRQHATHMIGAYGNLPKKVPGQNADGTVPLEGITVLP